MTTVSGTFVGEREPAWQAIVDRWMFVGMAALITVAVLVGFAPDSLMKLDLLAEGRRPPLPLMMHVHAVL
ncbi:MAG: hypothetical protein LW689_11090, partial [Novosphingobium sp.]|nr:hypothetical protein [Novosphingobium sp.]